jgi:benzoyl-CoA 2,3-dioxygenase component B
MPDYRWGIFLEPAEPDAKVGFGDNYGQPAYQEVPGEFRNRCAASSSRRATPSPRRSSSSATRQDLPVALRPAQSVSGERRRRPASLGHGLPAARLLRPRRPRRSRRAARTPQRQSRQAAHPRSVQSAVRRLAQLLRFTMFTDRDGKYQLSALAESGFEPLARTCQFMLTEEAHHMFVGDTGSGASSNAPRS